MPPLTIEVTVLLSIVSVSAAIYFGLSNLRRNQKTEDRNEATQMATINIKLDNIGVSLAEIKTEIKSVKDDVKELSERTVMNEASSKQAHRRIDEIAKQLQEIQTKKGND